MIRGILTFWDAALFESDGGGGGGSGEGQFSANARGSNTPAQSRDRSPSVTSFGPTANGGWSVTNSAGVTTTTNAQGMQTTSRSGGGGSGSGSGEAPAPARPAQRAPAPVAPVRVAPATTTTTAPVTRTAGPPLGTLTTAPARVGTTTAPAVPASGVASVGSGLSGRAVGSAGLGAALAATGSAAGRAGAVSRQTASAEARSPSTQRALDPAPATRSALANSNVSWFGANRAGQVATEEPTNRGGSFAPPSQRSAERSSMAALEAAGGVSAVRDAVARDAGRQAANPRASDQAFTSPSRPSGYQASNFDPLGRGSTSNPGFGARIDQAFEVANSGGLDAGAGYSVSPSASAGPVGYGQATSRGGSIASTGLSGAFSPQVGLGNSMGVTSARGRSYNEVPSSMIGGWNTPANSPAFSARAAAMNMDTPQRTASVSRVGASMAPVGSVVAGRSSFDALSGQSTARSTQPMSFVEMQRMAQEAQNRSMIENPYMAVAGPITADKVRAVDAALATIAKEVRGFKDPYNTVVRGKTPPSPITEMTIREAADYAAKNGAVGFAQFVNNRKAPTLPTIATRMGFDLDNTRMTPAVQQTLAIGLIQQRANQATRNGVIDPVEFGHALAQEWAAFTSPKTGKGVHDGDKYNNKAYVSAKEVQSIAQGLIDSGAVAAGRNVAQMTDQSVSSSNMAPGMARAAPPATGGAVPATAGQPAQRDPLAGKLDQSVIDDPLAGIPPGYIYGAEDAPANPVAAMMGPLANNPNGLSPMNQFVNATVGLMGGLFAPRDGSEGAAPSFVGTTGDGEGRLIQSQGQEAPPEDDPAPATTPAVNVAEASSRFVNDYLYPPPPVKWPARQLTFQT